MFLWTPDAFCSATRSRPGPPEAWTFSDEEEKELNELNERLVSDLQNGGRFYPSATKVRGRAAIRVCIVNYLAEESDMEALLEEIRRIAVGP